MKLEIPVKFELPKLEELPIALMNGSSKKPQAKDKKAMADAQAFAKFGVQVLRVKARVLAALGKEAEECGIKQIGHGKILLASDNAEAAIAKLGSIVDKMMEQQPGPDYDTIVEIVRLQKEFNSQLIKAAEAHFNADKQPSGFAPQPNGVLIPYPPGSAVMVGVGKSPNPNGA